MFWDTLDLGAQADQAHAWGEKKKEKVVVKSAFANVVAGMGGHMSAEARLCPALDRPFRKPELVENLFPLSR